jgi:hypothetical protein
MTLQEASKIAKGKYDFAKVLNYAYKVKDLYALVFTKKEVPGEILGGTMIIVNTKTNNTELLPVRPQVMSALRKQGKLEKVYSVAASLEQSALTHSALMKRDIMQKRVKEILNV